MKMQTNQSTARSLAHEPEQLSTGSLFGAAGSATLRVNPLGCARVRGKADRKRAGSFLVLVVGTLALLAIITIVFVALGSQDSRTRSATEARAKLDVVPPQMADYISDITARDAVATQTDFITSAASLPIAQQAVRETTDAPGTRYDVRTFTANSNLRFNPVGTMPSDFDPLNPGAIAPSDPWLASTTPTDLTGTTGGLQRPDWNVISNVAPDGAFVNLVHLRGQRPSDVSSATLRTQLVTNNDFVPVADQVGRPAAFSMRQIGSHLPAAVGSGVDWSDPAMKANQWADTDGDGWLDSRWFEMKRQVAANQFVDEISLGDRRTRYFMAVRIIDLSGLVNIHTATDLMGGPVTAPAVAGSVAGLTDYPLGLTPADIDVRRLLMGVDAMKDSTGGDVIAALSPTAATEWPVGSGLSVNYENEDSLFIGSQSYIALRLSTQTGAPLPRLFGTDPIADDEASAIDVNGPVWLSGNGKFEDEFGLAPEVASPYLSVAAIARGVEWRTFFPFGPSTTLAATPWTADDLAAAGRTRLASYLRVTGDRRFETTLPANTFVGQRASLPFGIQDLAELLERHGVNSDRTSALESALSGRVTGLLALDPLRSNRPQDFELAVADFAADASGNVALAEAELLKTLDVRSKLTTLSGARHLRPVVAPPGKEGRMVGSWQTGDNAQEQGMNNPLNENKLDVVAALSYSLYQGSADPDLTQQEVVSFNTFTPQPETILPRVRDPQVWQLFNGYAAALAPYSILNGSSGVNAWEYALGGQGGASGPGTPGFIGTPNGQNLQTLFYGHRGPHVAMQVAAHMAVNMADIADPDDEPTVATIEFRQNYVRDVVELAQGVGQATVDGLGVAQNLNADDLLPGYYAMEQTAATTITSDRVEVLPGVDRVIANQRLTVENDVRVALDDSDVVAPVMNVYGIEPQPFITQVAAVTVYQDNDAELALTGQTPSDSGANEVFIRGDIDANNHELLYRAVIVQLSNPFDRPIKLSAAPFADTRKSVSTAAPGAFIPEPLKESRPDFELFDPGSYVPVNELVANDYTASRLDNFFYLDVGDANVPSVGPVPPPSRGKRFVLASLKEKTFVAVGDNSAPVQAVDAAQPGRFIRLGSNAVIPAAATAVATLEPIIIPPGETVTCIALSRPPSEVSRRILAKDAEFDDLSPAPGAFVPTGDDRERVLRVIARQFAGELDANGRTKMENVHWIPQIDVDTGAFLGFGTAAASTLGNPEFQDVVPTLTAGSVEDLAPQYVSLWRTVRGPQERQPDTNRPWSGVTVSYFNSEPITPANDSPNELFLVKRNNFENDQLVDRMMVRTRDLAGGGPRASLDLRLPVVPAAVNSDYEIDNAVEVPSGAPGEVLVGGDEVTLTLAAWVRRPSDAETPLANGTLPAWAMEPKYYARDLSWNLAYRTEQTREITTAAPATPIDINEFSADSTSVFQGAAQTVAVWRQEMDGSLNGTSDSRELNVIDSSDLTNPPQFFGEDWVGNNQPVLPPHPFGVASFEGAIAKFTGAVVTVDAPGDFRLSGLPAPIAANGTELLDFADTRVQVFHAENTPALAPDRLESVGEALNHRKTLNALRLTDLLLPAGIGPFSVPIDKSVGGPFAQSYSAGDPVLAQFLARHTTLGEALAEVLGYSTPFTSELPGPDGFAAGGVDPLVWLSCASYSGGFTQFDIDVSTRTDETLFDGVNLALDRYVPFFDSNANSLRDLDEPAAMSETPVALGVMDQFVIAPPASPEKLIDQGLTAITTGMPQRNLASSETKAQPGLVNINTAPVEVLRALPGVAPVSANNIPSITATPEYDWASQLLANQLGSDSDFSSMLESYRTFGAGYIRESAYGGSANWAGYYQGVYNSAANGSSSAINIGGTPEDLLEAGLALPPGRTAQRNTGVAAVVQGTAITSGTVERGLFRGLGETLNARLAGQNLPDPQLAKSLPIGADYLAYNLDPATGNEVDTSLASMSRFRAKLTPGDGNVVSPNLPNGYDEKLALVGSFANTVTTRSDYYAAWFVIHGYREEDTTNLVDNTQALIPSVQRRYLMILDRSEVTQLGQKPKVLLLKEVPYEFPARK